MERIITPYGYLSPYNETTEAERSYLQAEAEKDQQNIFYPYQLLSQRISMDDPKKVDYKWAIRDTNGQILGLTSIYALGDGYYNVAGMFLVTAARNRRIGRYTIYRIHEAAQEKLPGYKGLRVRVSELNRRAIGLVQSVGFIESDRQPNRYVHDIDGLQVKSTAIIYELTVSNNSANSS